MYNIPREKLVFIVDLFENKLDVLIPGTQLFLINEVCEARLAVTALKNLRQCWHRSAWMCEASWAAAAACGQ
jgi:hypothetical protein